MTSAADGTRTTPDMKPSGLLTVLKKSAQIWWRDYGPTVETFGTVIGVLLGTIAAVEVVGMTFVWIFNRPTTADISSWMSDGFTAGALAIVLVGFFGWILWKTVGQVVMSIVFAIIEAVNETRRQK